MYCEQHNPIMMYGKPITELRSITDQGKVRLNEFGVKLNQKKCKYEMSKIKFLGHIISTKGVDIDNDKTDSIDQSKSPKNLKELQRVVMNDLSRLIPS